MPNLHPHVPVVPRFFTLMEFLGIEFPDGTLQTTAGGGGGVSVVAGTGITITGGNIVNIAATGVTAGDYSNASIAVNAEGQIMFASSGAVGTPAAPSIATAPVGDFITATGTGSVTDSGLALTNMPTHAGEIMISQPGNTTVAFADPLVQGLYAAGSTISSPPAYTAATTIQPILMGGSQSGVLQPALLDASGYLYVDIGAGTVTVTGSVAVTGTFWQATQPVSGAFWQATQPVSIATMPTTPVTGTFWQTTQPVSGTFWQATQPVSLASTTITGTVSTTIPTPTDWGTAPLTSVLVPAVNAYCFQGTSPWVVGGTVAFSNTTIAVTNSGTFAVQAAVTGTVSVSNFPASQAVTGTFWQATQPVSLASTTITGTVAVTQSTSPWIVAGGGTAGVSGTAVLTVQGIAGGTALPVSGTFWQATQPVSGAISFTAPQHVIIDSATLGTVAVSGTFWQATQPVSLASTTITGTVAVTQSTSPWVTSFSAPQHVIVDSGASGGVQFAMGSVQVSSSLGTIALGYDGTNVRGLLVSSTGQLHTIIDSSSSIAVTGTFWQATQPVSIAAMPTTPVTGTFWQTTQPVSLASTTITGTVAVTQSTSPWIVAGGGTAGVPGTAVLTVQGIAGGTAQPVSGTFWQTTQPISGAISFTAPQHVITDATSVTNATLSAETTKVIGTVNQGTSPWVVSMASTTITGSVTVTGTFWQATQPVSGTFWQTTQPVSGTVAFSNTTIAVTNVGTFAVQAAQSGTWTVGITGQTNWGTAPLTSVSVLGVNAENFIGQTALAAVSNYGTAPSAVAAMGVNAFITNTPAVTLASTTITGNVTVVQPTGTNLHTVIDSGTITTVSTVTAVTAITNALPAGGNTIGKVDILGNAGGILDTAKGTQSATAVGVQELKDAGRNMTNYFMAVPIITTTAEVMQSLTGYKSGAAVVATATPAVVTAGKTYRIQSVEVTYWAATVIGGARINLRANLTGVGVVGSPLVKSWQVGVPAIFTAGSASTYTFDYPDGLEFAAGTGIAIGVIGEGAVPTTGTITGYVLVAINGYEY